MTEEGLTFRSCDYSEVEDRGKGERECAVLSPLVCEFCRSLSSSPIVLCPSPFPASTVDLSMPGCFWTSVIAIERELETSWACSAPSILCEEEEGDNNLLCAGHCFECFYSTDKIAEAFKTDVCKVIGWGHVTRKRHISGICPQAHLIPKPWWTAMH